MSSNLSIHFGYIVLAAILSFGAYVAVRSWLAEHDARLQAEKTVAVAEQTAKSLSQQIADRDKVAAQAQQVIVKVVHDTTTPAQAVQNIPQVVSAPLPVPITPQPTGDLLIPKTDVMPIFQQLADDKLCRSQLDTASKDLTDTKSIVTQRDVEIVALKKKPSFWKRVAGTLKVAAIGVGVGIALTHGAL